MKKLIIVLLVFSLFPLFGELRTAVDVHRVLENKDLTAEQNKQLIEFAKKKFKNIDLKDPNHRPSIRYKKEGGGTVAWFFEAKSGSKVEIFAEKNRHWPMREIGKSGLFVASEAFPDFTSVHFRYTVNGYRHKMAKYNRFGFESYTYGAMSLKQDGVPEGKLIDMGVYKATDEFYKGTERKWWIYVPAQYKETTPAKLIFFNDGGGYIKGTGNACTVMDNLINAKKMPVSIAVFMNPGEIKLEKKTIRNRGNEYDTCTPKFANFLEKEILPQVYAKYNVSKKAEDHLICGSSSGASCAFTAAWHRNDLFSKVISFVGSYCDFRQISDYPLKNGKKSEYGPYKTAHDYPALIRKTMPNKNIKIYLQDGVNDLDNNLGNWYKNNERMADALAFSGYTFKFATGKGMHSKKHGMSILPEVLEWIWK